MFSLGRCGRVAKPRHIQVAHYPARTRVPQVVKKDLPMFSEPDLGPRQPHVSQDVLIKERPRTYIPDEQVIELHREGEGDALKCVRAAVASYRGKLFVEIRQWEVLEEDDELLPSNKGINLTLDQYRALCAAIPQLDKLTKSVETKVKDEGW